MVPVKKFREAVFYSLFAFDLSKAPDQSESFFMEQLSMTKKNIRLAFLKAQKIVEVLNEIDPIITEHVHDYQFERISKIERNALRLGLFEALYEENMPKPVVIAEAVRITKKFGSLEGSKFVNGVLDAALNQQLQKT